MRTRVSLLWLIGLFNAILLLAGPARAQFSGNIEGVVTDPSGGSIGSAKITITNLSTNVSASTTSDSAGYYHFLSLAPGRYKVRVEASGFAPSESAVQPDSERAGGSEGGGSQ